MESCRQYPSSFVESRDIGSSMIEKRLVQWYASDAGIDLDIAEREIVLTYVLRIMANRDHLSHLHLKGGTAIRKLTSW